MTPRDRERRRETEKERVFVSIPTKKTSNAILSKKAVIEREREREVFWSRAHFVAESVPKAPVATARTTCQRRVLAERLLSHSSATPPPTFASFSKRAPRPKTHASIFLLQVFRPSLVKSLSPFGGTHTCTTRKNPHASSLPRARTSSPFLARENRRRRNERIEEERREGSHLGGVDHHRERRRHFFANASINYRFSFVFAPTLLCFSSGNFESLNQEEATQKRKRKKKKEKEREKMTLHYFSPY